jgi:transketolase
MALAERMLAERLNCEKFKVVDHDTYVILGDGCMMEGVSGEACSVAGHLKLGRLVALYDANNITIDGTIDISFGEDVAKRYEAYGWNVLHADGNDFASLAKALDTARASAQASVEKPGSTGPTLIVCRGIAGKGAPKWEGKPKIHGNPMSAEDVVDAKIHLGVEDVTPFSIPAAGVEAARTLMESRTQKFAAWQKTVEAAKAHWKIASPEKLAFFEEAIEGKSTGRPAIPNEAWAAAKGKMATRVASGRALSAAAKLNALLVGGSADLAGSNNTTLEGTSFVNAKAFGGRNIHFGVREHGMGAIVNGMALHGGLRPYCATFAVFSDYMRPPVRLASLMKIPSLFIFTHDSYAVGEDGPTHQPVEHAAALRAIPDLNVFRPADGLETFAAWQTALEDTHTPTAFLLTRQDLPDLDEVLGEGTLPRTRDTVLDGMRQGGYLLKDFGNPAAALRVCLVASGSEVALSLRTARELEAGSFQTLSGETVRMAVRVVSAPAPQLLAKNPVTLNTLLPADLPLIAVEAGSPQGWGEIVGRKGAIYAMKGFGASAPASKLDAHFGFVPEALATFVKNFLSVR